MFRLGVLKSDHCRIGLSRKTFLQILGGCLDLRRVPLETVSSGVQTFLQCALKFEGQTGPFVYLSPKEPNGLAVLFSRRIRISSGKIILKEIVWIFWVDFDLHLINVWPLEEAAFYWSLRSCLGVRLLATEKVGKSFLSERVDNFEKKNPALECVPKFGVAVLVIVLDSNNVQSSVLLDDRTTAIVRLVEADRPTII